MKDNPFAGVQAADLAPQGNQPGLGKVGETFREPPVEPAAAPVTDEQAAAMARYGPPTGGRPEPPLIPPPINRTPKPALPFSPPPLSPVPPPVAKHKATAFRLTLRLPADLWDELGSANVELDITTGDKVKTLDAAFKFWHSYLVSLRKTYLLESEPELEDGYEEEEPDVSVIPPRRKARKPKARKKTRSRRGGRKKATPKQVEWLGELGVAERKAKRMTYQDAFDLIGEFTEAEKDSDEGTLFTCCECGEEFYVEDELPYVDDPKALLRKIGKDNITCEACR